MQRDLAVGAVQRLPAPVGLLVDRVARLEERHHVGDRVVHDVAVAVGLQVHRLVEVHRAGRVDGHELQVGQVAAPAAGATHGRLRGLLTSAGNSGVDVLLLLDRREPWRSSAALAPVPAAPAYPSHPSFVKDRGRGRMPVATLCTGRKGRPRLARC